MKSFLFVITFALATLFTTNAFAGPWHYEAQNIKLPTQSVLEHRQWINPAAASATYYKSGAAISSSTTTTITTFSNSATPDFSRNVTLTPTGTTSNVAAGTAVVSGTNIFGQPISENFAITSTQSTATTGAKAFRTLTSVVFPKASGSSVTLSIGTGAKMGVIHCSNNAGDYVFSEYGGVYDTTRGTYAVNATDVSQNTFTPNSSADGAHNLDLFSVQNFRCYGGQ